ncbi:MAG: hypothetical protein NVSMB1_09880 [Polyangiales bacterium]
MTDQEDKLFADLSSDWQTQEATMSPVSLDQVMAKARKFQRRIWFRNLREHLAATIVVLAFGARLWSSENWAVHLGCAGIVIGAIFISVRLAIEGRSRRVEDIGAVTTVEYLKFYRRELIRQRDLLKRVVRWYLAPLVPGTAVLLVGELLASYRIDVRPVVVTVLLFLIVFVGVARLNAHGARKLQREIDALGPPV